MQFPIGFKQGVQIKMIVKDGEIFKVHLTDDTVYSSKTVLVTTGKSPRRLNVPGEKELIGRGVAYCAICDAPLYAGLTTAVVGGGNSAVESAIDLCKIAKEVHIIQMLDELTADSCLIAKLNEFDNFTIHYNCTAKEIKGDTLVTGIEVTKSDTGETFTLDVDGIFIAVGLIPNTKYLDGFLKLNDLNEIVIDHNCLTSVKGVFAAGDVTSISVKQIIVAAGEGAKAALAAHQYLLEH
jgi:alkyl hydroperoxide reductase subunit F